MVHYGFLALDKFRFARAASRNGCSSLVDLEARAAAYGGRVLSKVLGMKEAAHTLYRQAMMLALACAPRNFSGDPWFNETRCFLEQLQAEQQRREQERRDEELEPILEALEPQIKALKLASQEGADSLLGFVYAVIIPDTAPAEPTGEGGTLKKRLQRAIFSLHPDKHTAADRTTRYLYEEVVKYLNAEYSAQKGL